MCGHPWRIKRVRKTDAAAEKKIITLRDWDAITEWETKKPGFLAKCPKSLKNEINQDTLLGFKLISPDNHFNWVDPDAQTLVLRDDKRHTTTAVSHLGVEIHPFSWWRLGHDVEVNLCEIKKQTYPFNSKRKCLQTLITQGIPTPGCVLL